MRTSKLIATALFACLLFASIGNADEPREEKPRFKGVELYSWKTDGGEFRFVLIDGANRVKTAAHIKAAPNQLKSVGELQAAIKKLAFKETVAWIHRNLPAEFVYPPKMEIEAIRKTATMADVELYLPKSS